MKSATVTSTTNHIKQRGFTLIEIVIVTTIVALLSVALFAGYQLQTTRARDARRKADLLKIQKAFDSYYDQYECYPMGDVFGGSKENSPPYSDTNAALCGTEVDALQGHLVGGLPCDPTTGKPYVYFPPDVSNPDLGTCSNGELGNGGYRMYTNLQNITDPSIQSIGCDKYACGVAYPFSDYNYGVAMGTNIAEPGFVSEGGGGPIPGGPIFICQGTAPTAYCNQSTAAYVQSHGCRYYLTASDCEGNNGFCRDQSAACE